MNLIYACVFHQESYINLLKLLINSIYINANINKNNTEILIITIHSFQPIIEKELSEYDLPISYYLLDLHGLFEAGCARLNIFKYEKIEKYEKILYLDTDILINSDINVLFNINISNDKIYGLEEGNIGHEYWGGQFFDFSKFNRDQTGFTSGILYFYNSIIIKELFEKIQLHINNHIYINKNMISTCLDQPFIVYNAIASNNYDNQLIKKYLEDNPKTISEEKIIYHFSGGPGNYNSKYDKMTCFFKKMKDVHSSLNVNKSINIKDSKEETKDEPKEETKEDLIFITLTNTGYIDYTLNCLESLKKIEFKNDLICYVIGNEGFNVLNKKGYKCNLINEEQNSNFQIFRRGNWADITFHKFTIIYENLLKYKYVCFTDGDIVYENNDFLNYLKKNIENYDMLVQSEGDEYDKYEDYCTGFMFIKSNQTTLDIFNPETVIKYKKQEQWDDQIYLNEVKTKINYKKLPLNLFPNGKYYYNNNNENLRPYLIHFNWVEGHEKKNRMKKYNKWYNNKKVKICQYGTDGFGHQLEGILTLISLSLNNKADYQYNFRKSYTFAHNNIDIKLLNEYLFNALNILSNNNIEEENKDCNIIYNERRKFNTIISDDENYEKIIYFYDGVGCGFTLPENFEQIDDLEKSLPKLRNAFVINNKILPKPSYDNKFINVCCHIRLGDAVGTRVLDNESLYDVVKYFQNENKYRIIIHSDGNVDHLQNTNTILKDKNTDVLQILSDFINADILIMNYSSLSISAHLLAKDTQFVICPSKVCGFVFNRILKKCIKSQDFLSKNNIEKNNYINNYINENIII